MRKEETESDILKAICDYLAMKKHMFWRQNTSPVMQKDTNGWRFRRMPVYSMNGVPDIILIKDGFFVGLEVKKKNGKQSPEQKEFERRCKEAGGEYWIVKNIDDVVELGL